MNPGLKTLSVFCLVFFCQSEAEASFQRRTLNLGGGVSTINSDSSWGSPLVTYLFGVGFARGSQSLGLGSDINFAWRRFPEPADILSTFDSAGINVRMMKIEIPVHLRIGLTQSHFLKLGVFYSKGLGDLGRSISGAGFSYSDSSYATQNWETSDYGGQIGWMVNFKNFDLNFLYSLGILDLYNEHPGTQHSRIIDFVFSYGF